MKKVIIQDTNKDLLETISFILSDANYEVLAISPYKDVLTEIETFKPDLVMLDFKLSGLESIVLCSNIKKNIPAIPVIALSCNTNIDKEYARAGFDDYLTKPFDLDYLFTVIARNIT